MNSGPFFLATKSEQQPEWNIVGGRGFDRRRSKDGRESRINT